ncbi:hypothetical protein Barb6XT_01189 [Bacteroidales bacterium Barb6XT]|nr:hypothetical protein Barb6XT_01189 [Bacteroidales bacterium Barb6XT]
MKQLFFIFFFVWLAAGTVSAQQAVIAVEQSVHDFGDIKEANGRVSHTFVIANQGDAPLVINRVIASCGCTTPEWTKEPIAPGKTGNVKVTFDPEKRVAPFLKTISIYSNGKTDSFVLTIRGNVIE